MAENFTDLRQLLQPGQLLVVLTPNDEDVDTFSAGVLYSARSDMQDESTEDWLTDQAYLAVGRGLAFLAVDDPEFVSTIGMEVLMDTKRQNAPSSDEIH